MRRKKRSICCRCLVFWCSVFVLVSIFLNVSDLFGSSSALGSSCTMTKRDSLLAGFTYPSSSMSMPRRHSWRSRSHGYPSSTAAPSDPFAPSRSVTDPTASDAGPSLPPAGSSDQTSHYGYSTADTATPIQLLLITRLQFFQDLKKKPIHSRWNWQKLVVSSMHITSSRFKHLKLTIPNRHFADLW